MRPQIRLHTKFIMLITIVVMSTGLLSSLIVGRLMHKAFEKELEEKGIIVVQTLAELIAHAVIDGEVLPSREALQDIISRTENIDFAYIIGFDGNVFAHSFEGGFPRTLAYEVHKISHSTAPALRRYSTEKGLVLEIGYPLIEGMTARIHVGMNESHVLSQIKNTRNLIMVITFVSVLLGIILSIIMSRRITHPLRLLAQSMRGFGSAKVKEKLELRGGGLEVTDMTQSFNIMITGRKQAEEALQKAHDELELRVKERTAEWKAANEQLLREIAERKRAEKALKASQAQLIQSEKMSALGTLVAGVAHELNNPMMGIINYIQYCLENTNNNDERFTILQNAERATKKCISIVDNLLTFSHMEKEGEGGFQKESCATILQQVLNLLSYRIEKERVSVIKHYAEGIPEIWMKVNNIQQVFLNIITNALDALRESEKKEIHIDMHRKGEFIQVTVSDSGTGISPENLQKIYDPFFTTKPPGKGTGLGLSICQSIIDMHEGRITCESKPGQGAKFEILLPIEIKKEGGRR